MPTIWRKTTNHATDCMEPTIANGLSNKKKWTVSYPNIPSAMRSVPHHEIIPVSGAPESYLIELDDGNENEMSEIEESSSYDHDYMPTSVPEPLLLI